MIKTIGDRALPFNREHWSLSFSAQFKAKQKHTKDIDLATKLRRAWQVLRIQHPSIACIAADGLVHYFVPEAQSLDAWTGDTFFVADEDHIATSDLVAGFKPGPHLLCTIYRIIPRFSYTPHTGPQMASARSNFSTPTSKRLPPTKTP